MVFWAYFSLALVMCAPAGILVCYSTDLSISLQPLWLLPLPHPRTAKLCFPWNLMEGGKLRRLLIPRDTTFYWQAGHLQRPFCQKDLLLKRILKFQFGYEFMGKNGEAFFCGANLSLNPLLCSLGLPAQVSKAWWRNYSQVKGHKPKQCILSKVLQIM